MGGLSGIAAGLIGSAQGEKSIDLSQLLSTLQGAGEYQRGIINALPAEVQANLGKYAASLQGAGAAYKGGIDTQTQAFLDQISNLYGPNSQAAQAANVANRQQIYSTTQGTQDAIRNALAATGGLNRGQAGVALAQPYVRAAQQYGQAAAGVTAQQTAAQQQAKQQALTIINQLEAGVFQQLFGMSKEQAAQILQTGNVTLQNQLAELINQSNTQTQQTLGIQGIQAQNAYQNALQQQGYQSAIYNGLANAGLDYATGGLSGFAGIGAGLNGTSDVTSPYYQANMAANAPPGLLSPR